MNEKTETEYFFYKKQYSMTECLICYEEKEIPETKPEFCQHAGSICEKCLDQLKNPECPYCKQDWTKMLHRLPLLWRALYMWIGIVDNDLPLLELLLTRWKVRADEPLPFEDATSLLVGSSENPHKTWIELPMRPQIKAGFLKVYGIVWDETTQSY